MFDDNTRLKWFEEVRKGANYLDIRIATTSFSLIFEISSLKKFIEHCQNDYLFPNNQMHDQPSALKSSFDIKITMVMSISKFHPTDKARKMFDL